MKQVFTDISHIAHLWANQLQSEARNSGNFFFRDDTIYSYGHHFPIAKHIKNADGVKAVLFTERSYSVTTSKHISVVRQAASHLNIIYCYRPDNTHADNFKQWLYEAEQVAANLPKAKKPEKYLSEIARIEAKVKKYAEFFNLTIPETLLAALSITNKNEYLSYSDRKKEYELAEQRKAQAELRKRHKKALNEWLKGKTHRLYLHDGYDYLRLMNDRIETSQAVQIPLELGKRIYQKVAANTLTVGDKILDYEVNEVGEHIKVGCHKFKRSYLVNFGQKIFA